MNRRVLGVLIAALVVTACSSDTSSTPASSSTIVNAGSDPASVRYVSVDGDDSNSGLSEDDAYLTLSYAVSQASAGEEIRILPGTYYEGLTIDGLGSKEATTTIMGYDGIPVFHGGGSESVGLFCKECTNVVISCLEVTGYTDIGIGATQSNGVVFRDLIVHHNGSSPTGLGWGAEGYGIHVDDSTDVLIEYTDVHDNGPLSPVAGGPILGTGINTFNLHRAVIKDNSSYRNHGGGILVEDSIDVLVEKNRVFENDLDATAEEWWDGGLWLDGGRDVIVRDNSFFNNRGPGIEISDEDGQNPTGYVIEGNVSSGNYFGVYVWNFGGVDWPDAVTLGDNDFSGNERQDVWIEPGD